MIFARSLSDHLSCRCKAKQPLHVVEERRVDLDQRQTLQCAGRGWRERSVGIDFRVQNLAQLLIGHAGTQQ